MLSNPFGEAINLGVFAWPVTVLWLVGIANAINLMDGVDGAAAGISAIAGFTLVAAGGLEGNAVAQTVGYCLIGSCLGFLLYNFHPARVFMGDCGALPLGFILAAISIFSTQKRTGAIVMLVPIAALALPMADTSLAVVRRLLRRKPIMRGDRSHVHHNLLDIGLGQRNTVLVLYGICAVCALTALGMLRSGRIGRAVLTGLLFLFLFVVLRGIGAFAVVREWFQRSQAGGALDRAGADARRRIAGARSAEEIWEGVRAAAEVSGLERIELVLELPASGSMEASCHEWRWQRDGRTDGGEWSIVVPIRGNGRQLGELHAAADPKARGTAERAAATVETIAQAVYSRAAQPL